MTRLAAEEESAALAVRHECRICWTVYDPAEGDPAWQISPGTPFAALPAHWTCPNCAATKEQFLEMVPDTISAKRT